MPEPPRRNLSTPSRYRDAMPAVTLDDEALEQLIARCTAMAESYCGRPFARERVVETARGRPVQRMVLARTPVTELHGITRDGELVAVDSYILSPNSGLLTLMTVGRYPLSLRGAIGGDLAAEVVLVDYTGGWIVPEDTPGGDADLPADLEHACQLLVRGEIDLGRRGSLGLASERLGDAARTYTAAPSPGLAHARALLNPYRRRVL